MRRTLSLVVAEVAWPTTAGIGQVQGDPITSWTGLPVCTPWREPRNGTTQRPRLAYAFIQVGTTLPSWVGCQTAGASPPTGEAGETPQQPGRALAFTFKLTGAGQVIHIRNARI